MNIKEITDQVRKLQPEATQTQVARVIESLGKKPEEVLPNMISAIANRVAEQLAPTSGKGFTPAPKSDRAPQAESSQLAPVSKNASQQQRTAKTFEEARDRKVDTAAKVATGGDRFVADVLEEAEQLADEELAKEKTKLAKELSKKMVEHRLTQAQETVDFFMLQWGSTDALLNPFRQAMANDEEMETIEVQTA